MGMSDRDRAEMRAKAYEMAQAQMKGESVERVLAAAERITAFLEGQSAPYTPTAKE